MTPEAHHRLWRRGQEGELAGRLSLYQLSTDSIDRSGQWQWPNEHLYISGQVESGRMKRPVSRQLGQEQRKPRKP